MKLSTFVFFGLAASIASAALLSAPARARSESSMKCGTRYINLGASLEEVEAQCGPPSGTDSYERAHPSFVYDPGLDRTREVEAGTDQMNVWTYDRGSTRFVRTLTFENGTLIQIKAGGYGG